jgi:hypothetical protein
MKIQSSDSCPSEVDLDLFFFGDCSQRKTKVIGRHVEDCAACQKRLDLRRQGFAAFEEVDQKGMLAGLQKSIDGEEIPDRVLAGLKELREASQKQDRRVASRLAPQWIFASVLFVLIVGGLIYYQMGSQKVVEPQDSVVIKGSLKLVVYREHKGKIEETFSGEKFQAGDRLRFSVDIPFDGYLLILGVEQGGKKYQFYPAAPQKQTLINSGKNQLLAGASRLDDSLGEEWIHLVLCPRPISLSEVELNGDPNQPVVDAACVSTAYKMVKVAR